MQSTAMTAAISDQKRSRLAATFFLLFDDLREYMRAYAITEEDQKNLPKLDLVWVTSVDGGPEKLMLDAIATEPAIWTHAIPEECCIVPRSSLAALVGENVVERLAMHGAALVENLAARRKFERSVGNTH